MRKLLLSALFLYLAILSEGQKNIEKEVYFTALHKDGTAVESLSAADLKVPSSVQIEKIERLADTPVRFGLLLDNSGSRRGYLVGQAEIANQLIEKLMRDGKDLGLVINFNEDSFIDQNFTADKKLLEKAVAKANARGASAVFDVVASASEYLHYDKQHPHTPAVLLMIGDGVDNASRRGEEQAIARLRSAGVRLYAFRYGGMETHEHMRRGKRILEDMAQGSGGRTFDVKNGKQISIDAELAPLEKEMQGWFRMTYTVSEDGGRKPFRVESAKSSIAVQSPVVVPEAR